MKGGLLSDHPGLGLQTLPITKPKERSGGPSGSFQGCAQALGAPASALSQLRTRTVSEEGRALDNSPEG